MPQLSPQEPHAQPVDGLLRVVAGEMSKLVELSLELQEVNPALQGGGRRAEDIKAYQALDYITQSLQALTAVCQDMALNTPETWTHQNLESLEKVTLADLKAALKTGSFEKEDGTGSAGVVDLFDS